jgi:glycosyltransferase involved in cell wall biosynthesis
MRLCVITPFPPDLNGISQYAWNVVHGLAHSGQVSAVTVLAEQPRPVAPDWPAPSAPRPANGHRPAPIVTRRLWARDDLLAAPRLARTLLHERPDVVWLNLDFTMFGASRPANFLGLLGPALARRAGRPLVVTLHQILEATPPTSIGAKNGPLTQWGLRTATQWLLNSDAVCVTLRRYQHTLRAHYAAPQVHHIPLGAAHPPEWLPHPPGAPPAEVLFFGFAAPFKGLGVLLEAFERLKRTHPQATLTIAGPDHKRFPGYQAALRAGLAARNGHGPQGIRWLGPQSEAQLREVFARARVVALPYMATTGASSVLHRAAALGRPMVASDLPDLRAAAEEEGLSLDYAAPGDPAALAAALAGLLADPARQAEAARRNLAVMRALTLEHTCARYLDVFERARAPRRE